MAKELMPSWSRLAQRHYSGDRSAELNSSSRLLRSNFSKQACLSQLARDWPRKTESICRTNSVGKPGVNRREYLCSPLSSFMCSNLIKVCIGLGAPRAHIG
jgi:hypothetical protein